MMSTGDVSQMFASQNSMFMGQNSYAQQIGVPTQYGAAAGGVGAYGGAPRGGSFSYSPAASFGGAGGYGGGNKFASMATSALGGAASIGAGMAFDPLGSFLGGAMGGLARGGIGAALGGGMMAAAPMLPIALAAQVGIGGLMRGGQQQAAIAQNLGSYQFQNAGSRTGQGFSRDDSKAIGDQIRSLAHVPEMMTSVDELTKLMPKLKASGVMSGVRSAAEFSHRFKEAVSTIRDMSKVLGSTMEEAEQFFAQSRSLGFTGRTSQMKNTLNAGFTAAMTGMDMGQVGQMQQTGAGMARSVGGRGAQGATAIAGIAQRLEAGRQAGRISEDMIQDVSGQGGALGVQGSAERMYGLMLNFRNTAAGRLVMAGAMKRDGEGKVQLDEDVIKKFNSGSLGIEDLKRRASGLSDNDKISFSLRAGGSLGSQLAGSLDAGHMMQGLVGGKGKDAAALVLSRQLGANEQEVDMLMGMGGAGGSNSDIAQMGKQKAREAAFRERTDPSAILKRLGTRLRASTVGHIEQAGAKIYSELGKTYDEVMDEFLGRAVVSVSKGGADSLSKALSGGSKEEFKKMIASAAGLKERGAAAQQFGGLDALALTGSAGAAVSNMAGGGGFTGAVRKLAGGFRNTDMAAFLMRGDSDTGRSMESQAEFTRSITGGAGMTDAARAGQGRMLNAGLKMGETSETRAGGGVVQRLRAEISNFRGMDDERKLVELRSSIQSRIAKGAIMGAGIADSETLLKILSTEGPGAADKHLKDMGVKGGLQEAINKMEVSDDPAAKDAAKLLRVGLSAQKAGAADVLTGIIAATQGKFEGGETQVNISKALRLGGDVDLKNMVKQSQAEMNEAKKTLTSEVGEAEAGVIAANPHARKALSAALDPTDKKYKAVRAALDIPDADAAAKALNQLGFAVKASDIDSMKKTMDKGDAGGGDSIKKAIEAYEKGEDVANYSAIASASTNKSKEIAAAIERTEGLDDASKTAAKAVQDSLAEFGKGPSEAGLKGVQASIGSLVDQISKGGKGAEGLVSATGDLGAMAQETVEQSKSLKGNKGRLTQEAAAKAFGLDLNDQNVKEMLATGGVAGGIGSKGVNVDELTKKVAAYKAGGVVAKKGQQESGAAETGEQKLLDALLKIDKTLDKNMAVMTLVGANAGASISKESVAAAQQKLQENNPPPGSELQSRAS